MLRFSMATDGEKDDRYLRGLRWSGMMALKSEARVVLVVEKRWNMECTSWLIEMSLSMTWKKWENACKLAALTPLGQCACVYGV